MLGKPEKGGRGKTLHHGEGFHEADRHQFRILVRENMEEWATNSAVLQETVRATVEAFAKGQIKLPEITEAKGPGTLNVKIAPSFIVSVVPLGARPSARNNSDEVHLYYTNQTLAEFLGWVTDNGNPQDRVTDAVAALAFIEQAKVVWDAAEDAGDHCLHVALSQANPP